MVSPIILLFSMELVSILNTSMSSEAVTKTPASIMLRNGKYIANFRSNIWYGPPLPIAAGKGGPYQMLDLKLAMYLPFLSMMEAGVFVTASDDIEVFNMDTSSMENSKMMGETVTALAHPSSLYIGTTHGVYVMTPAETKETTTQLQDVRQCLEVLQKPSVDLMRERGAVQKSEDE